jgi:anhydro-N-acetylmuramic acid kinase
LTGLHVGLISGTSMDGIDAALIDTSGRTPSLIAAHTFPFDPADRDALDQCRHDPDAFPGARLAWLDARLGDCLGDAALAIIRQADLQPAAIRAVGSHGQTLLHRVAADPPHTLQIGDPHRIVERTGLTTVADFRRADVAAGGQGAPLAPLLHAACLGHPSEHRVVVNLGGIANLTRLRFGQAVTGCDTGPANCYLDLWYRRHHEQRFDRYGDWAAGGRVDPDWLARLMNEPYLRQPAPKSTGIEYFSAAWLDARLPDWAEERPRDVQATLAEFSAASLAGFIHEAGLPDRVILCGGGVHNRDLVARIRQALQPCPVDTSNRHGLPADDVEAMLFAWLAAQRLTGHVIDTGSITGARHPVHLGVVHSPPGPAGSREPWPPADDASLG